MPGREPIGFLLEDYRLASIPFANLLPRLMRQKAPTELEPGLLVLGDVDYEAGPSSDSQTDNTQLLALIGELSRLARTRGCGSTTWNSLTGFREELSIIQARYAERFGADATITSLSGADTAENSWLTHAPKHPTLHLITHGYFEDPSVKSIDQAEIGREPSSFQQSGP